MVVRAVQLLVELDHKALEEGREFLLLLPRLKTQKGTESVSRQSHDFANVFVRCLCVAALFSSDHIWGGGWWWWWGFVRQQEGKHLAPTPPPLPPHALSPDGFTT